MAQRKARSLRLEEIAPGLEETGPMAITMTATGKAFFRPAIRPRAWDRLSPGAQDKMADLQHTAAKIHELQGDLEDLALELRNRGASWDLIGWAIGTSGQAARKRWGSE